MIKLDNDTWKRLFPLLEEAQEHLDVDLEHWMHELSREHPDLEPLVREMLASQAETDDFLRQPYQFDTGQSSRSGQDVGAYTIDSPLGAGGMGEVWLAHRSDGRFQGMFAVKFLSVTAATAFAIERFRREGRMLARLTHPNIARLIDAGVSTDGHPYLVLEYVRGETIDTYCEAHDLGVEQRLRLMLSVLDALAHAHTKLIVHRDIKPSNVMVTGEGEVKLLDFGVAKLLANEVGDEADNQPTRVEDIALTPDFAAPEQILGESPSTATDVYQAGVLIYLLLAGRLPSGPPAASRAEKVRAALDQIPPLMSEVTETERQAMRGDLDSIVARALRKRPEERYPTAADLAADLRRHLNHEPISARDGNFWYRAGKFVRRYRSAVLGTAAAALVLISSTAFALLQMQAARLQRDQARLQERRGIAENQFLTQVMSTVGSDSAPVTPTQILEKGVSMLDHQYANDPAFRVDLLIRMASGFMIMNDEEKARKTLAKARLIAAQLPDPIWTVRIECAAVETELSQESSDQAEASLQKGRAALARIRDANPVDQARCMMAQSYVSQQKSEFKKAIEESTRAVSLLESNGLTTDPVYEDAISSLQVLYSVTGDPVHTYEYAARQVQVLQSSGYEETQTGVGAHHNLATALTDMGEFRAAIAEEEKAVSRMRSAMSSDPIPAVVLITYGSILLKLDRLSESLQAEQEAVRAAQREKSLTAETYARQAHARLLLASGRLDEADTEVATNERLMRGHESAYFRALSLTRGVKAAVLRSRGKLSEARAEIEAAIEQATKSGLATGTPTARYLLVEAARIAIADNRFSEAENLARQAFEIDQKRSRDFQLSANAGESLLLMAMAQRGLGEPAKASATAARAYLSLKAGLGPEVKATREAADF